MVFIPGFYLTDLAFEIWHLKTQAGQKQKFHFMEKFKGKRPQSSGITPCFLQGSEVDGA